MVREQLLALARALSELANVTTDESDESHPRHKPTKADLLQEARHQFKTQLLREAHFEGLPFHETGWEILLELYIAEAEGRKLNVTAIGLDGHIPNATLVRWIALLEHRKLVFRQPDTIDRRRTWIGLTSLGSEKLDLCLRECVR